MALPRPLLLALVGAVLALAAFFATSGARNPDDVDPVVPKAERADPSEATVVESRSSKARERKAAGDRTARSGSDRSRTARTDDAPRVPAAVARALARKRTVVLFFRQRDGADDDATARAVARVRGRRGAAVFSAPISRLPDYAAITSGIGITQAPAVVIVGRSGKARLIEGFIDPETLSQEVADSR